MLYWGYVRVQRDQLRWPSYEELLCEVEIVWWFQQLMRPLRECDLLVKHNGERQTLTEFQIIKHKYNPLLSAEMCEKLQLIQLNISTPESVH